MSELSIGTEEQIASLSKQYPLIPSNQSHDLSALYTSIPYIASTTFLYSSYNFLKLSSFDTDTLEIDLLETSPTSLLSKLKSALITSLTGSKPTTSFESVVRLYFDNNTPLGGTLWGEDVDDVDDVADVDAVEGDFDLGAINGNGDFDAANVSLTAGSGTGLSASSAAGLNGTDLSASSAAGLTGADLSASSAAGLNGQQADSVNNTPGAIPGTVFSAGESNITKNGHNSLDNGLESVNLTLGDSNGVLENDETKIYSNGPGQVNSFGVKNYKVVSKAKRLKRAAYEAQNPQEFENLSLFDYLLIEDKYEILYMIISTIAKYPTYRSWVDRTDVFADDIRATPIFSETFSETHSQVDYLLLFDNSRLYKRTIYFNELEIPKKRKDAPIYPDEYFSPSQFDIKSNVEYELIYKNIFELNDLLKVWSKEKSLKYRSLVADLSSEANLDILFEAEIKKRRYISNRRKEEQLASLLSTRKRSSRLEAREKVREMYENEDEEDDYNPGSRKRFDRRSKAKYTSNEGTPDYTGGLSRDQRLKLRKDTSQDYEAFLDFETEEVNKSVENVEEKEESDQDFEHVEEEEDEKDDIPEIDDDEKLEIEV